jgi:hypothetical protein
MTASNPASLRRLVARSDGHPALVVPESGAALSYAARSSPPTARR